VGCDDPIAALSDSEVCRKLEPDHPHVQQGGERRRGADDAHFACRVGRAAAVRASCSAKPAPGDAQMVPVVP
jgi:hypothetical protein